MKFRLRFWPTLGTLVGLSLLVSLGTWQLTRYQERRQQEQTRDERLQDAPREVRSLGQLPGSYARVQLRGTVDPDHLILFKHRTHDGKPGGWLGGVFRLEDGGSLLLNLGWVHRKHYDGLDADILSDYEAPLSGVFHRPERLVSDPDLRARLTAGDGLPEDTIIEADSYDLEGLQTALDGSTPTPPAIVVLGPDHARSPYPVASYDHVTQPYLTAARHLSYSVFWYATGLALLGLYLAYAFGYLGAAFAPRQSE